MQSDSGAQGAGDTWGSGSEGVGALIVDQLEELIVTLLEAIRTRPSVAIAIVAGVAGAVVGSMLASRLRPRRVVAASAASGVLENLVGSLAGAMPRDLNKKAVPRAAGRTAQRAQRRARGLGKMTDVAELAGLAMQLLENPIVRGYLRAALASQVQKRFRR